MKLFCAAVAFVSLAHAQQLPEVQPPVAVDVNVESISWNPNTGTALTYVKNIPDGKEIGIYAMGQKEGEVVLRLGAKDRYEVEWFGGQPLASIVVYRNIVKDGAPMTEASIYLADAVAGEATKLWAEAFPAKKGVSVSVDGSPRLRHAIFRVMSGSEVFHLVLPAGSKQVMFAQDLDKAFREGYGGPVWSVDGTAIYREQTAAPQGATLKNGSRNMVNEIATVYNLNLEEKKAATIAVTAIPASERQAVLLEELTYYTHAMKAAAPAVNTPVLELMPMNPVLRNVRFKGAWQGMKRTPGGLELTTRAVNLSPFTADSLWLTIKKSKAQGTLISPHAQRSWMAPFEAGVAYLTDGALFVRAFK